MSDVMERRLTREEKKSAAANKENERLRQEVRQLRQKNFTLQLYIDDPASQSGYLRRYEELLKAVSMARDMLTPIVDGLPVEPPTTLPPPQPPEWARLRAQKLEGGAR